MCRGIHFRIGGITQVGKCIQFKIGGIYLKGDII